jgi:hypothetical protein
LLIGRLPFNAPSISQLFNEIVHAPFPRIDPNHSVHTIAWLRMERTVRISTAIDGWGRPANRPMVPTYTVVFSQVSPVPGNEQSPLGARRVER